MSIPGIEKNGCFHGNPSMKNKNFSFGGAIIKHSVTSEPSMLETSGWYHIDPDALLFQSICHTTQMYA